MSDELFPGVDAANPLKEMVQPLLEGLKFEAAKLGVDVEVEDLGGTIRVGIETLAELHRFLNLASCGGPLPFRFDVYLPVGHLADVLELFLNRNESEQDQPPAAT
jgi:hypothetical protein